MRYVLHVGMLAWPLAISLALAGCEENGWGAGEEEQEVAEPPQVGAAPQRQDEQQQQRQRQQQQAQQQQAQQQQGQQQQGTISGQVQQMDEAQGTVTLQSNGQQVTLAALPATIANLSEGQQVNLRYQKFGQQSWVETEQKPQQMMEQRFQQTETLRGTIEDVNKNEGRITVQGREIRAHPKQIENLSSGSSVNVTYAMVQDQPWLLQTEPTQQQGGQQQGGEQQQQQGGEQQQQQGGGIFE